MTARSPRGHNFAPIRQFGQRYSFVLDVDIAKTGGTRSAPRANPRLKRLRSYRDEMERQGCQSRGLPFVVRVNATIRRRATRGAFMKYLCTIYGDESQWNDVTPEQMRAVMDAYFAFSDEAGKAGVIVAGEGLERTSAATTVRVRDGERVLSDGPFAETKEQLGGFYLLECANLDEAIDWAAKIPGAATGSVEVRPVMNYEGAGSEDARQSAAAQS